MIKNGSHDEKVAADNEDNESSDGNGHRQDECPMVHILAEHVVRATEIEGDPSSYSLG